MDRKIFKASSVGSCGPSCALNPHEMTVRAICIACITPSQLSADQSARHTRHRHPPPACDLGALDPVRASRSGQPAGPALPDLGGCTGGGDVPGTTWRAGPGVGDQHSCGRRFVIPFDEELRARNDTAHESKKLTIETASVSSHSKACEQCYCNTCTEEIRVTQYPEL